MCFIEMRRLAVSTRYVNASINIQDKKPPWESFQKFQRTGVEKEQTAVDYRVHIFVQFLSRDMYIHGVCLTPRALIFVYSPERVQRCGYYPGLFRIGQHIKLSNPLAGILHYTVNRGNFSINIEEVEVSQKQAYCDRRSHHRNLGGLPTWLLI